MENRLRIRQFIENNIAVLEDEAHFSDSDNVFELGIVNSLFAVKILNYVEREFGVEVEEEDMELENFSSVNNILGFIEYKRGSRDPGPD